MAESSPNPPEESRELPRQVNLTGSGYIRFASVVFALGAAFFAFDAFLQLRRVALNKVMEPILLSRSLLYGFTLTIMAFLLWSYAGAIRDFPASGEAGVRRLERAHIDMWRWGAILLAAHLIFAAVVIVVVMPF
jgi:hypothetical protein